MAHAALGSGCNFTIIHVLLPASRRLRHGSIQGHVHDHWTRDGTLTDDVLYAVLATVGCCTAAGYCPTAEAGLHGGGPRGQAGLHVCTHTTHIVNGLHLIYMYTETYMRSDAIVHQKARNREHIQLQLRREHVAMAVSREHCPCITHAHVRPRLMWPSQFTTPAAPRARQQRPSAACS